MENMKRALSAFLAFVLVLGMVPAVPMFASAEEVELQPETMAVETIEAVTEETAAPETTAPAETVPETTAALETEPQETVPVEAMEEVEASEEAVDAEVPEQYVQGITVTAGKKLTYVGDSIELSAVVTPDTAVNQKVIYTVLDSVEGMEDYTPAGYDEEDLLKGIVTATEPGKIAIAWKSEDGYDPFDVAEDDPYREDKLPDPIILEFVAYRMDINERGIPEENRIEEGGYKVMVGKTLDISVRYYQMAAGQEEELLVPDPLHTPAVKWTLSDADKEYATLEVSKDTKTVTVIPKNITEERVITLYAVDEALQGDLNEETEAYLGVEDSLEIKILRQPYKISIRDRETEEVLDGETITVNVTELLEEDPHLDWIIYELEASVMPAEAEEEMVWSASDMGTYVIHEKIEEDPVKYDTTWATIKMPVEAGKTVITVASENDPEIQSTVTFERKTMIPRITFTAGTRKLEGEDLIAGKSVQLQAVRLLPSGKEDNESLDPDEVEWTLGEGDEEYVTLSENGKLTAKTDFIRGKYITVFCSIIGDEASAPLELHMYVRPKAKDVEIFYDSDETPVTGETLVFDIGAVPSIIQLRAEVNPLTEDEHLGAKEAVTWTSSNTAIAKVKADTGEVEWKTNKKGTVTITAAAKDGSNKKATVKLLFGTQIESIYIDAPNRIGDGPETEFNLPSGKSWTFDVVLNGGLSKPSIKDLEWTLVGEDDGNYATISSKGKITAKTVYESKTVTVRATAKDGTGVYDEVEVHIRPKNYDQLSIRADDEPVTKTTKTVPVGESLYLEAYSRGELDPATWGPAKNSVVEVVDHEDGTATVTVLKAGSATITATAADGSKRKATFVVKGVQLAEDIDWTHTHYQTNLASGKSLTLKAKAYYYNEDGDMKTPTISKLAWSFLEEDAAEYATISNGKVTAKSGYTGEPVDLTVVVKTTDGSDKEETWPITIAPAVEGVRIYRDEKYATAATFPMLTPGDDQIELEAKAVPGNVDVDFTWKTSNKNTATVEDGVITCLKPGTVTITATANDGSGKKATFKLKIVAVAQEVGLDAVMEDETWYPIAGGKNLSLKSFALDGNYELIKGKKVEWSLEDYEGDDDDGMEYASLSGSTLKTKAVSTPKRVVLTVKTKEDNEDWVVESKCNIVIRPATTTVYILNDKGNEVKSTAANVGQTVELYAQANKNSGYPDACQAFVWKSSNPKVADFVDGQLVCFKKGKTTITATAIDGTKKSAKVTLEVLY